jgi:hypothetical protein
MRLRYGLCARLALALVASGAVVVACGGKYGANGDLTEEPGPRPVDPCSGETFAACSDAAGNVDSAVFLDATISADASSDGAVDAPILSCSDAPDPIAITGSCAEINSYDAAKVCTPEVHVVGVYEASSDHTAAFPATVNVDLPGRGPITLVVSSYEPVKWTVTRTAGTTLTSIIVAGFNAQTVVTVPVGVPVTNNSGVGGSLRAYGYKYGQASTTNLLTKVQAQTGLPTTSHHGCYTGTSFTLQ